MTAFRTDLSINRNRDGTLVDEITRKLRRLILSGEYEPGKRLVELDLAEQTGSSQGSVREALQRLERDNLVVRRGRTGTFVTGVSPEDMHEIFLVRCVVESAAIRRTARTISAEQIEELEGLLEDMREAARKGDTVALVERDMAFHQRICAWADHPTLLRTWVLQYTQLERYLVLYDMLHFSDLMEVANFHVPILEALKAGDTERAVEALRRNVMMGAPPGPGGDGRASSDGANRPGGSA